jgi:hypothetical protein
VVKINGKKWATSAIFKKLPKVNNHPMSENSPNLVTLHGMVVFFFYIGTFCAVANHQFCCRLFSTSDF